MIKHTPGPWRRATPISEGDLGSIYSQEGKKIAKLFWPDDNKNYRERVEETIANERLITAAPELLQAAEEVIKYCEDRHYPNRKIGCFERLKKAIKKAKGNERE